MAGTWEYVSAKGKSFSKPSFSGSMLIFRGVWGYVFFSRDVDKTCIPFVTVVKSNKSNKRGNRGLICLKKNEPQGKMMMMLQDGLQNEYNYMHHFFGRVGLFRGRFQSYLFYCPLLELERHALLNCHVAKSVATSHWWGWLLPTSKSNPKVFG